ncbi:MAG: GDP-mannose 4,6-dehydratase, partial [Bacteroidia bacterium]|nr:GDP-mannose 4,6-dehydratase [Bacteroidia bacterium]
MKQKILITGTAGFIGSHVTEHFLNKGYSVCGIDNFDTFYSRKIKERNLESFISHPQFSFTEGDLTDAGLIAKLPEGITSVIHLAAKAGVRP